MKKILFAQKILIYLLLFLFLTKPVLAAPYFYLSGSPDCISNTYCWVNLRLYADQRIGALQVVLDFDTDYFAFKTASPNNTICSVWAFPNSPFPAQQTPYLYGTNQVVFACGITGAGYLDSDGRIAQLQLTPLQTGTSTINISNAYLSHALDSSISLGAMGGFDITVYEASATPTPTAAPTTTPTPTPIYNVTTIFDDVTVSDLETSGTTTTTSTTGTSSNFTDADIQVIELDDTVPAPPADLTPRPAATPYQIPENYYQGQAQPGQYVPQGEVMAVQGLRDLLVPGKTQADKTVVMVNFISTITFLIILAILLWRLISSHKSSKTKAKYIKEMISGELAALEGKISIIKESADGQKEYEAQIEKAQKEIMETINPQKTKKSKKDETTDKKS